MPQPRSCFALEDALSLIVFVLPGTCSVGLSLMVAAAGPLVFFFCHGANHRSIATLSCIQAVLGALIDPASIPLLLGVVALLIARVCLCLDVWNDAQLGVFAWRIGWTLTLAFACLHMFQGSPWTVAELLPVMPRDDTLGKEMVRRSAAVIIMDVGVSVLGVAIEHWMVPFRNSTILFFQIGERQLLLALACILMVMICASIVIHNYCLHVAGALLEARGLERLLSAWWGLLHIVLLILVSTHVNGFLLLNVLRWCLHRRYLRWSWSSIIYEVLVHDIGDVELDMGPIPASQVSHDYGFDALVTGVSASAYPEVHPLGNVVLEAGGLIRTQRGQQETLFQLIQSRNQAVHIQQISGGPRSWARVRVSFDDEAEVRRITKEIARERSQRVNIRRVEVVYHSPRD